MGAQQTRKILVQDFNEKKLFSIYDVDKNPGESIPGGVGLLPFSIRKFGNGEMRFYVDGYQQNRPLHTAVGGTSPDKKWDLFH